MNISYDRNATMFSAVSYNAVTRSKDQLAAEEQDDKALAASGATGTSNIQTYNSIKTSGKMVMFDDPQSGNRVQLQLTDENLKRLEEKFGKQDFYTRSDGTIRLSGKAEAFVSGWFSDVAYRQNYVSGDTDNDGVISQAEFGNLRIGRGGMVYGDTNNAQITDMTAYARVDSSWYNEVASRGSVTAADALNRMLSKDENLDGVTTASEEFDNQELQELVRMANNSNNNAFSPAAMLGAMMEELAKEGPKAEAAMRKKEEEEKKLLEKIREQRKAEREAIEKLREKNGDVKSLDTKDQEILANSKVVQNNTSGKLSTQEISELAKELQENAQQQVVGNVAKAQRAKTLGDSKPLSNSKTLSELDKELISVVDNIREQTKSGAATAVNALDTTA